MRVLLMRPNSTVRNVSIPLGLLYLASTIRKKNEVMVLDSRLERTEEKRLRKILREFKPDVVGISLLTVEAGAGHRDAGIAKQELPHVKVVVGGPYPSADPHMAMMDMNVDITVIGEGEETLSEIAERLTEGGRLRYIQGIAYREDGEICMNPERPPSRDLDSIPFPAYDLIHVERYFRSTSGYTQNMMQVKPRALPIYTSRGCPFGCIYCHKIFGKNFRLRSPGGVIDEVRFLRKRYGIEELHISDDIFNFDKDRAKRICEEIERDGGILIAFPNGLRADLMDEELIRKMKSAGAMRIIYAIESGSRDVQRMTKKNLDLDKAMWSIEKSVEMNINTGGFFMLGFPGETKEEMMETIDFACASSLHTASFFYVTPFPGTELYDCALRRGFNESEISALYMKHDMDYNKPIINLSSVNTKELIRLKKLAIRKFYFSLQRCLGILRTMPSRRLIVRNAFIVLKLGLRKSVDY